MSKLIKVYVRDIKESGLSATGLLIVSVVMGIFVVASLFWCRSGLASRYSDLGILGVLIFRSVVTRRGVAPCAPTYTGTVVGQSTQSSAVPGSVCTVVLYYALAAVGYGGFWWWGGCCVCSLRSFLCS